MGKSYSVCGCDCVSCDHCRNSKCSGCDRIQGKVWWATYISATVCPVYDCVKNKRALNHCGECPEIPCSLWLDLKDPSYTDEQHAESIRQRVELLKRM